MSTFFFFSYIWCFFVIFTRWPSSSGDILVWSSYNPQRWGTPLKSNHHHHETFECNQESTGPLYRLSCSAVAAVRDTALTCAPLGPVQVRDAAVVVWSAAGAGVRAARRRGRRRRAVLHPDGNRRARGCRCGYGAATFRVQVSYGCEHSVQL